MDATFVALMLAMLAMFCVGWFGFRWAALKAISEIAPRDSFPLVSTPERTSPVAPESIVAPQAPRPPPSEQFYVCLKAKGQKPRTIKVATKARRHRINIDGDSWDHYGEQNGMWLYTPTEGQTARQRHLEARR